MRGGKAGARGNERDKSVDPGVTCVCVLCCAGVRPFQCPYCDYSSSQKTHLTRHMRTHSGERPFKCESCNYLAANQHEVTRHARQVHNGPKPLSCPYCEYKTADRSNFKKHVELHLNPRQFLCPLCKYAASKKCNLQYHIKSRHAGCSVAAVDISKVRLRVKKPDNDGAEGTLGESKADDSSGGERYAEDSDMDAVDDGDDGDDGESSPINLSIRKSGRLSGAETETRKSNGGEREKLQKVKEKAEPEKRVPTRQKKTEKICGRPPETEKGNVKRRVKKTTETEKTPRRRSEEHRDETQNEEKKSKPEREQKKNESSGKENKNLNKPRKSGEKKAEKTADRIEDAPRKSREDNSEKTPDRIEDAPQKPPKEKAAKRKATEALDLSQKTSAETPPKAKRLRAPAVAEKDTKKIQDSSSSPPSAAKPKKSRSAGKKALERLKLEKETTSSDLLSDKMEVSTCSSDEKTLGDRDAPAATPAVTATKEEAASADVTTQTTKMADASTCSSDEKTSGNKPATTTTGNGSAQQQKKKKKEEKKKKKEEAGSTDVSTQTTMMSEKMEVSPTCSSGES
ncbi:RE1-silencing transcription factor [Etheostoma cragini]|uniref:RE1-silencing transcription factor n=1 Tax=Etheostoma cragini TaxID=417921 RepID=UPI00155E6C01|nr:RE1-silencing transcription factor [Etheostoma cragini]